MLSPRVKGPQRRDPDLGTPALEDRLDKTKPLSTYALDPKNFPKQVPTWRGVCHGVELLPDERHPTQLARLVGTRDSAPGDAASHPW